MTNQILGLILTVVGMTLLIFIYTFERNFPGTILENTKIQNAIKIFGGVLAVTGVVLLEIYSEPTCLKP